jgi:hypothetical protein
MEHLPAYLSPLFIVTTALSILLFAQATPSRNLTMVLLLLWSLLFGIIAYAGFFLKLDAMPPRLVFMMAPAILIMILFFVTKKGRAFLDQLSLERLTILHVVRLPVEIILMLLAIYKTIPELLTFEGRNFDIIMGLTALPVAWWVFKRKGSRKFLLAWNILGIILLMNVVIHGVLSVPLPIQQFAFEQPNVAMLYAPYNLLPGVIVPIVMFSHLAAIRKLLQERRVASGLAS